MPSRIYVVCRCGLHGEDHSIISKFYTEPTGLKIKYDHICAILDCYNTRIVGSSKEADRWDRSASLQEGYKDRRSFVGTPLNPS